MRPRPVKIWTLAGALFCGAGCQGAESPQAPQARWHNNQGVVYMDQHNYSRGRDEFNRAVARDPRYANGFANLGIAYFSLGKYDSALVALHSALKAQADHPHALYTLGLIYLAQGKEYDKALQVFSAVRQRDGDDPLVHYYLGRAQEKLGRAEEAAAAYEQSIRLDPHNVSAYYALAQLLRQQGKQEEFQRMLGAFNQLQQAGNEGVSSSYQGQGKYAEVVTDAGGVAAARDDARGPLAFATPPAAPELLRFAALGDVDRDGDLDVLAGGQGLQWHRNDQGAWTPAPAPGGAFADAVVADFDNDQDLDLALAGGQALLVRGQQGGWGAAETIGVGADRLVAADVDHDGDLDLLLLSGGPTRLLSNDGTGSFAEIGVKAGLGASAGGRQAVFSDFDNDRDVDFVVVLAGAAQLYTNNRDGTFADIAGEVGLAGLDAADLWVEDFDQDGYMDLAALSPAGQVQVYLNKQGRGFGPQAPLAMAGEGKALCGADFDNDGDVDLLAGGSWGLQPLVWREGKFQVEGSALQAGAAGALAAELDGDGRPDIWAGGQVWRNQTQGGRWIEVALQGLNSNRAGVGTKVEVKTTHRLQKRELRGGGQDPQVLHFGLAESDSVEFVRLLWPGGVRQTELATGAGQRLSLTELNRKGTSCPILYAWDGQEFRFVTDILGGAIVGYLLAPGEYYPPDSDEYVRLGPLAPLNGSYELRLANQLEEIIYLDQLQLVAVDHPEGVEVLPNERLLSAPPYPEFRLYPLSRLRPLRGATDQRGREVGPVLRAVDDEWYGDFGHTEIHGYAQEYALTLDLGDLGAHHHPVLVGYGWVDYAHSSSNWAAAQQGLQLRPVRLEVPGPDGGWRLITSDMGVPAGLPKHMVYDLKGVFERSGDYRVRLSTNTPVYWDQFLVGEAEEAAPAVQRLLPAQGELRWRGYPAHTAIKGTFAFRYHYDQLQTEADWGTHQGAFTRHGEVTELLQAADDRFVIMFHGDEVSARFDAAALPPPPPGQRRSFLLYADGFGKDMDFHSAHSLTVEPLPFHGMSSYPYPAGESYPLDESRLLYLLEYNTRQVKGHYD
ncbi:MAG: VCBS repeat-containing protein [Candidatus Handelsmanbacteria bacterium]|nr:VCBS repeat-containing protein [Candidatus Handelsmanbacteria bacterium]